MVGVPQQAESSTRLPGVVAERSGDISVPGSPQQPEHDIAPRRQHLDGLQRALPRPLPREGHGRSEREETETENAERIVRAELHRVGWTEADLGRKRKGDLVKVRIATRLRKETAVTLKWIAHRLHMGTWTHVTNRLYHAGWRPGCVNT